MSAIFVRYSSEFIITVIVITEFDCTGGPSYSLSQYPRFRLFAIRFQKLVTCVFLHYEPRLFAIFFIFPLIFLFLYSNIFFLISKMSKNILDYFK
jgi:hypothetical protein